MNVKAKKIKREVYQILKKIKPRGKLINTQLKEDSRRKKNMLTKAVSSGRLHLSCKSLRCQKTNKKSC